MSLYRMLPRVGKHVELDGKEYGPGDTIETDRDLKKLMPEKFELVHEIYAPDVSVLEKPVIPGPDTSEVDDDLIPSDSTSEVENSEPEVSEHGTDVTDQFEDAKTAELKVYKKGPWYSIVDPDNDQVLSEKKLRQNKVAEFLAQYVEPLE